MSQQQPMMNYSDRFQQNFQQPQFQNQRASGINGRFVGRIEDVTANEVSMDGSVSLFPQNDLSVIYAKSWNADGTIKTIAYKPILEENIQNGTNIPTNTQKAEFEHFNAILDDIKASVDDVLASMDKVLKVSKPTTRKKESDPE